jgi:hypothetical protein
MNKKDIRKINSRLSDKRDKISKAELFQLEKKINLEVQGGNTSVELSKLKRRTKHILYECRDCADAGYKHVYDKQGEEKELFIDDCKKEICPYKEYFVNQRKRKELDKCIKKLLNGHQCHTCHDYI